MNSDLRGTRQSSVFSVASRVRIAPQRCSNSALKTTQLFEITSYLGLLLRIVFLDSDASTKHL